jgi:hypothetical protein
MTLHGVQCLVPETLPGGAIIPQTEEVIYWSIRQLLHIGQCSLQTKASSCWLFSKIAIIMCGTAHVVAFRVCTNCWGGKVVFIFLDLGGCWAVATIGVAGQYRMLRRWLWSSIQFDALDICITSGSLSLSLSLSFFLSFFLSLSLS